MLAALISVPTAYNRLHRRHNTGIRHQLELGRGELDSFHAVRHPRDCWRSSLPYRLASAGPAAHRPPVLHTRCGARCAVQQGRSDIQQPRPAPADTSEAGLRAEVAHWVRTLAQRIEVKAQNTQVAELYTEQFPELTPGEPDALGRIPLTITV